MLRNRQIQPDPPGAKQAVFQLLRHRTGDSRGGIRYASTFPLIGILTSREHQTGCYIVLWNALGLVSGVYIIVIMEAVLLRKA